MATKMKVPHALIDITMREILSKMQNVPESAFRAYMTNVITDEMYEQIMHQLVLDDLVSIGHFIRWNG